MNLLHNGSIFTSQQPITQNTTRSTYPVDLEVGESGERVDLAHIFLLTDLLDHEFQALSGFINIRTQLHTKSNLKH
jgi:hypothetical protein